MVSWLRFVSTIGFAFLGLAGWAALAQASVSVVISISAQTMSVQDDSGAVQYNWKVSTARKGYRTPHGAFKPIRLERMHYSTLYENSPMPFSIFFKGNFAIHGTEHVKRLGRPASHGCVRLAPDHARVLFNLVKEVGTENVMIRIVP